tara:strand:+ start:1421 stop:2305 length:885 start_codon:yes stop_codon:yes gene_type:complete
MDKLTSMQVFCRVATCGNFSHAARELRISPAMVTKHIASLEDQLSIRLLNRTTRKVSMTEAGESYLRLCQNLLSDIEEGEASLSELSHHPSGTLKLTAPIDFGVLRLAPAIARYLTRFPDVSIDINYQDRKVNLVEDGFDIAIRIGALPDSSLIAVPLMKHQLVCCASPGYLEEHGLPRHPTELRKHNCLTYSYSSTNNDWHFRNAQESLSIKANGRLNANNGRAMVAAAAQGVGIILKPQFMVQDFIDRGELVPILENYEQPRSDVFAVYPHRRFLPAKMRSFIDYLKEYFAE